MQDWAVVATVCSSESEPSKVWAALSHEASLAQSLRMLGRGTQPKPANTSAFGAQYAVAPLSTVAPVQTQRVPFA